MSYDFNLDDVTGICCDDCGEPTARETTCPYAEEINDEVIEVCLCGNCYHERWIFNNNGYNLRGGIMNYLFGGMVLGCMLMAGSLFFQGFTPYVTNTVVKEAEQVCGDQGFVKIDYFEVLCKNGGTFELKVNSTRGK